MQLTRKNSYSELSRNLFFIEKQLSFFKNLILSTFSSIKLQFIFKIKHFTLSGTVRPGAGGVTILCTFYISN